MEAQLDTAMAGLVGIAIAAILYALRRVFMASIAIIGGLFVVLLLVRHMLTG